MIEHLKKTIGRGIFVNAKDPIWIEAFRQYNEGRQYPKSVKCRNCYRDVLLFHVQKEKVTT